MEAVLAFAALKFPKVSLIIKGQVDDGDKKTDKKQCSEDELVCYDELQDEVNPEADCKNEDALRNIANNSHHAPTLQFIVCYQQFLC